MGVRLAYSITGILHSIWGTSNLSIISSKHTHVKDWEPDCFTALQNVTQYTGLEFQMDNSMLGVSHEMKAINHDRLNKGLNGGYKMSVLKHIIELVNRICRDMLIIESVDSVGIALTRNMSCFNSSVHNSTLHIFNVERYVEWVCIIPTLFLCFLLICYPYILLHF